MKKICYALVLLFAIAASSTTYAQGGYEDGIASVINRPWSPEAKTAVLGAGGGAVLGAMLSGNHGAGALVGAILGGGAGYLFGKEQERRYEPAYSEGGNYRYDDRDRDYSREEYRNRDDRPAYDSYRYPANRYRRCD